jgi:hypothetical protein
MATIGNLNPTYVDWAKRTDPSGKIDTIVELLAQTNEVLTDATVLEANERTGHRTTVRTGLPSVAWRMLNYGVPNSKSTTAQITDAIGMLEAYAEIDKDLAQLNGNSAEFRLSEDRAFIEAMNQTMATTVFYGNTAATPERFLGFAPRYSSLSANNGSNIVDGGGTASANTSMWLVCWSPNTCHMIFPKGSQAGLSHRDLGEHTLTDGAGGQYQGFRTHYQWKAGLTLRDWRYAVRIANIDTTANAGGLQSTTPPNLIRLMVRAMSRLHSMGMGRTAFYANRTVKTWLDIQAMDKTNVQLRLDEFDGKPVTSFRGIPIRTVDALLNTESRVT